jgi:hypothetical protein
MIEEFRKRLAVMTDSKLQMTYKAAHNGCTYRHWSPAPAVVQEFVQVWREMRKRVGR